MSLDISHILRDWPYEPGQVTARRIIGDDGTEKIQLRLDLGLYQMETAGRPDGAHPHGLESWLDYHQRQLEQYRREHATTEGFELSGADCEQLRAEGVMYYHRYLAEFILEDFAAVERDTQRNLRVMDLCRDHGARESDRMALEQYRPYVIMMYTRASALRSFRQNNNEAALAAIRSGMEGIKTFYRQFEPDKPMPQSGELSILRAMAREIEAHLPIDPARKLRKDLSKAVKEERYEDAAAIRDKLRQIDETPAIDTDDKET